MSLHQHIQEQIQEQCEKHEHINLIPAEVANVGVRVACAEDISDLCQKNAEVLVLRVDPTKCTAEGTGTKVAEVGKSAQFTTKHFTNVLYIQQALTIHCILCSIS